MHHSQNGYFHPNFGANSMKTFIKKWNKCAAVRIPADVMAAAHVAQDQVVEVREEYGRIVIEPVRRKAFKLDELLGGITGKNLHKPLAMCARVGKEIW
jgi:antitoxin MazE